MLVEARRSGSKELANPRKVDELQLIPKVFSTMAALRIPSFPAMKAVHYCLPLPNVYSSAHRLPFLVAVSPHGQGAAAYSAGTLLCCLFSRSHFHDIGLEACWNGRSETQHQHQLQQQKSRRSPLYGNIERVKLQCVRPQMVVRLFVRKRRVDVYFRVSLPHFHPNSLSEAMDKVESSKKESGNVIGQPLRGATANNADA